MPRRTATTRKDSDASIDVDQSQCSSCLDLDPQVRSVHQLTLTRDGLDSLRSHLQWYCAQQVDTERRTHYVDAIVGWAAQQIKVYSGYVHPETGAILPWDEARRHCLSQHTKEDQDHQDAKWKTSGAFLNIPSNETSRMIIEALRRHVKDPWAHGHLLLMETGLNRPGRAHEAAASCRRFAARWPQDAQAWEQEACWWEQGAQGTCVLTREPGEEG